MKLTEQQLNELMEGAPRQQPLAFLQGFCLGLTVGLAIMTVVLYANIAHAEDRYQWRRVVNVTEVTITTVEASQAQMAKLMQASIHDQVSRASNEARMGYAELRRNKATGAYSCTIWLPAGATDDTRKHEERHCYGWAHG